MRVRILLRDGGGFRYGCEVDATDAEDVWRQLQGEPPVVGRALRPGDIVYIEDRYYELNGDGGWALLMPGPLTERLYKLAVEAERGA